MFCCEIILYSSTKAALDGLMRSLAVELAPKTRVNSILPGAVNTQMSHELLSNEAVLNKLNNDYLLGIGEPNHISSIILTGSSGLYEKAMGTTFPRREDKEYIRKKIQSTF